MKKLSNISYEYLNSKLKYLRLLSKTYPSISEASAEVINLEATLNLPKGTEHFVTDLHGEYEPFVHVLKNGSGVIKRKIEELFAETLSEKEKKMLATLVYYPEQKLDLIIEQETNMEEFYRLNIYRLIELCRYASSKYTRLKVSKLLPDEFKYIIEELLHEDIKSEHKEKYFKSIVETIIEVDRAKEFVIDISTVIQKLVVDRLHVIGDIYDRGPRPDIIVDKLMEHHSVDIQWGNHDILWMGAAAGEKTCIANALRISARYANLDILEDIYGINLLPLATFSLDTYKDDPCDQFMPKISDQNFTTREKSLMTKMHKAISIIQFKLEGEVIKRRPEFEMENRLLLDMIDYDASTINLKGKTYELNDTNFPTIDKNDPYRLSEEENMVMERLATSFKGSEKLQKHISFLFSKGSIYLRANSNLLIHGCVPLNEDGSFMSMSIKGEEFSGKELMLKMESTIREGFFMQKRCPNKQYGMDMMWYMWTGKCSSLFGKDDMTTFERYFIDDKESHKEKKNPYYKLREDEKVCRSIFDEFGLDYEESHIINGHVPVESKKGESPIKANGRILVIDGGFSRAYQRKTGIAGYTLIYNSRTLQLVSHEPFSSAEEAIENESDILSTTVVVEHKANRKMIRDTDDGEVIQEKIDDLKLLLLAYKKGLIKSGQDNLV
ncbi:fructose-1,6-bisphosphatase [Metaclostridioides mangenotii]|uniref:Fructose-1,6-bisphosphatase class 3 n=1 Tax=Metaclostridioides mangenotii TaxID=1540 RepID=A0ABS4E9M1_9FIRM|nr:fructose-1,6-bisphosphatase [Clostridioides mangenotii]MBP1854627.1 fructose-1,6-bisphosphatase-3 [Clostridioides mangenotii]